MPTSKRLLNCYAIQEILKETPSTVADLAARLNESQHTTYRRVKFMHEHGRDYLPQVHICGWRQAPSNNKWCAVYAAGPGEDAPLVKQKLTKRQYHENYMAKLRKDKARLAAFKERRKESWDKYAAKLKAKKWVDKHLTEGVQDPLLAAFYGMRTFA